MCGRWVGGEGGGEGGIESASAGIVNIDDTTVPISDPP